MVSPHLHVLFNIDFRLEFDILGSTEVAFDVISASRLLLADVRRLVKRLFCYYMYNVHAGWCRYISRTRFFLFCYSVQKENVNLGFKMKLTLWNAIDRWHYVRSVYDTVEQTTLFRLQSQLNWGFLFKFVQIYFYAE